MRTASFAIAVALAVMGCGDDTRRHSSDADLDASPGDAHVDTGIDGSVASLCSAPLVAPCDMMTLASSGSCPSSQPTEGTDCFLTPQHECFYCTGAEADWASQSQRTMAYCADGEWAYTLVACGAAP